MIGLLPLVVGSIFMVTAWTYCLRGWLVALMSNPRRRRAVIAAMTFIAVMMGQLPNLLNLVHTRHAPSIPAAADLPNRAMSPPAKRPHSASAGGMDRASGRAFPVGGQWGDGPRPGQRLAGSLGFGSFIWHRRTGAEAGLSIHATLLRGTDEEQEIRCQSKDAIPAGFSLDLHREAAAGRSGRSGGHGPGHAAVLDASARGEDGAGDESGHDPGLRRDVPVWAFASTRGRCQAIHRDRHDSLHVLRHASTLVQSIRVRSSRISRMVLSPAPGGGFCSARISPSCR